MGISLSKLQEFLDGQGGLAWCNPWGHKESDTTEPELNWTEVASIFSMISRLPIGP